MDKARTTRSPVIKPIKINRSTSRNNGDFLNYGSLDQTSKNTRTPRYSIQRYPNPTQSTPKFNRSRAGFVSISPTSCRSGSKYCYIICIDNQKGSKNTSNFQSFKVTKNSYLVSMRNTI
jgi:hypothetical protein